MADAQSLADGSTNWLGGMDTSSQPKSISDICYARACNFICDRSGLGLKTRFGLRCQTLFFKDESLREIYEKGKLQGEGYIIDGPRDYLVRCVNGIVFLFTPITDSAFSVRAMNRNSPNDQNIAQCWISEIPNGVVVNDGLHNPLIVTATRSYRTKNKDNQLRPGRKGVYVQNRFFYISADGKSVIASDIFNALSMQEYEDSGILGFAPAEEDGEIVAIGKQKVMLNYAEGGALIFATRKNIYSVDVRGDRNTWAEQNTLLGKVTQSVPGIGAVSHSSFETFNTNLFFRNTSYGVCDLRQSQYQFVNEDDFQSQSAEASFWFDNDTSWMLNHCYTRSYRHRLFTTVAPDRTEDGRVFWNGFISMNPQTRASQGVIPRRYESVITGVRPFAMTSYKSPLDIHKCYIDSYDADGVTRLYRIDDFCDYDTNSAGKRIEIESWLETRGYTYQQEFKPKKTSKAFYAISGLTRPVKISIFTRTNHTISWENIWNCEHNAHVTNALNSGDCINFCDIGQAQSRPHVSVATEKDTKCNSNVIRYLMVQDRFECKGAFALDHWVRIATLSEYETTTYDCKKEKNNQVLSFCGRYDYTYLISNNK